MSVVVIHTVATSGSRVDARKAAMRRLRRVIETKTATEAAA
jgi:hypothetical protein